MSPSLPDAPSGLEPYRRRLRVGMRSGAVRQAYGVVLVFSVVLRYRRVFGACIEWLQCNFERTESIPTQDRLEGLPGIVANLFVGILERFAERGNRVFGGRADFSDRPRSRSTDFGYWV